MHAYRGTVWLPAVKKSCTVLLVQWIHDCAANVVNVAP